MARKDTRSVEDCTKVFFVDGLKTLADRWKDVRRALTTIDSRFEADTDSDIIMEELLPALLVIEAQAVKSILDTVMYDRMKKALFMLVEPMKEHEFGEKFVALFNVYEREWSRANGNAPWDNVCGFLAIRLDMGGNGTYVSPIAILTLSQLLLKMRPPFWKALKEQYDIV